MHINLAKEVFCIVPARDAQNIDEKIAELKQMNIPFVIVCGEKVNRPNVAYRPKSGKWDAINYGASFIPKSAGVVILNDVDTKIFNLHSALSNLDSQVSLVYCRVKVSKGPQLKFYKILDPLRERRIHVAASGELMIIKKHVFENVLPIPPCIAEDSFILFKALESGYKAKFCTEAYVITERTANSHQEAKYKSRTTLGIYQALDYAKPPPEVRVFYAILPLFATLLILAGKDGAAWVTGIHRAFIDHITNKNPTKF